MLLSNQALWPTENSAVASGVASPKFRGGGQNFIGMSCGVSRIRQCEEAQPGV